MVNSFISILLTVLLWGILIWIILTVIGARWPRAKPAGRLFTSIIETTLLAIAELLWRSRLEREGGAQLSLPRVSMEEEEEWIYSEGDEQP